MAKKMTTATLNEILENLDEQLRLEIETTINRGLKSIGCNTNSWKNFEVYEKSIKLIELLFKARATEYIMAIADKADEAGLEEVKIIAQKEKETSITSVKWNKVEFMVVLSISDKRIKQLKKSL